MANQLFQQLMQNSMQTMLQNNPNYAMIMKLIQENNGDAKKTFYDMAQKMGVDPDSIIKQVQNLK